MRIAPHVLEAFAAIGGYAKPPQVVDALRAKGINATLKQVQGSMWNLRDSGELKSTGRTGRVGSVRGGAVFAQYWLAHLPAPDGFEAKPTPAPTPRPVAVSSVWAYAASHTPKEPA